MPGHKLALKRFDILGQEVATLVDAELESGMHKINFDGQALACGIYLYPIWAKGFLKTKKLMLLNIAGFSKQERQWDGFNDDGLRTSSGVYFYRIKAGDFIETKKMILFK